MTRRREERGAEARGRKRRPRRSRHPRRYRRGCWLTLLLVLILAPAAGALWCLWTLERPFQGYAGADRVIAVAPGMGAARVLARLEGEGVIPSALLARVYLVYRLRNPPVQAGEYRFAGPLTTPEVLGKLVRGDVITHPVTVVEGLALDETAASLARAGAGREEVLLGLMRSPAAISDLDPEARDLEGYLLPETYRFQQGTSEEKVVATLVKTFRDRYHREVLPLLAAGSPAMREIVTLASIVEKEAKMPDERPLIAGVYRNRLRLRMGLAADPTVIYALKLLGRWDGNIHHDDLRVDSPYNTYRYAGLPPGPICSPGLASLRAAARPADVPYLYFVSRNDGTHVFARSLEEHNRNVDFWQRRYWRDRRAQQPASPTPPRR